MLYKNRIVFFADILGFKTIIASSYTTDEVEEVTSRIATALKRIPEFSDDTSLCASQNIDFQFTQFSDCFIISFACEEKSQLFYTLLRIQWVQINLLSLGFLLRGAVTLGPAVHTREYVFGPAVVEAAELEKKSCFPRIIVQKKVITTGAQNRAPHHDFDDEMEYIKDRLKRDSVDGEYYVDYFASVQSEMDSVYDYPLYLMNMRDVIEKGLQDEFTPYFDKYVWMQKKYNKTVRHIKRALPAFKKESSDYALIAGYDGLRLL